MSKTDRETIRECLSALLDATGNLTPEVVLSEARSLPTDHPLHRYFFENLDAEEVVDRWLLDKARTLIRTVKVRSMLVSVKTSIVVPAYVRNPAVPHKEQGYAPIADVMNDFEKSRCSFLEELGRVESALKRAKPMADILGLVRDVDKLLTAVGTLREKAHKCRQTASAA